MNELTGFFQAIQDAPDDDTPRLVCADWLEENGQSERAELIRAQIELTHLPEDDDRWPLLKKRERQLLHEHGKQWEAPLKPYSGRLTWERGFLGSLAMNGPKFLAHGDKVLDLTPVWDLKIVGVRAVLDKFIHHATLGRVHSLNLDYNKLGRERLEKWLQSPHIAQLRGLNLSNNNITVGATPALARAGLPHLHQLILDHNEIAELGYRELANGPLLNQIQELSLVGTRLTSAGLEAVLNALPASGVRRLDLSFNTIDARGIQLLAASPKMATLEALRVYIPRLTFGLTGMEALANSPTLQALHTLELSLPFRADTIQLLRQARGLTQLRRLSIAHAGSMSRAVADQLVQIPWLRSLTHLNLAGVRLSGQALRTLLESGQLSNLVDLNLSMCVLRRAHLRTLVTSPHLPRLARLNLAHNHLEDKGVAVLARDCKLPKLTVLDLDNCGFRDDGIKELTASSCLARISSLNLGHLFVPAKARRALVAAFAPGVMRLT